MLYVNGQKEEYFSSNHLLNRGLFFGEGVFEVFKSDKTAIESLNAHLNRLKKGADFLDIHINDNYVLDLKKRILDLCSKEESFVFKVMLMRKDDLNLIPVQFRSSSDLLEIIYIKKYQKKNRSLYDDGISILPLPWGARDFAEHKTMNFLKSTQALKKAEQKGFSEALLFDERSGIIYEGASSNFFLVKNSKLLTPPLGLILPGITRARVLSLAKGLGIELEERILLIDEIKEADEAFVTSSVRGIMPLFAIGKEKRFNLKNNNLTQELIKKGGFF